VSRSHFAGAGFEQGEVKGRLAPDGPRTRRLGSSHVCSFSLPLFLFPDLFPRAPVCSQHGAHDRAHKICAHADQRLRRVDVSQYGPMLPRRLGIRSNAPPAAYFRSQALTLYSQAPGTLSNDTLSKHGRISWPSQGERRFRADGSRSMPLSRGYTFTQFASPARILLLSKPFLPLFLALFLRSGEVTLRESGDGETGRSKSKTFPRCHPGDRRCTCARSARFCSRKIRFASSSKSNETSSSAPQP
jgi:hypothetical protein